jgi:hypothetical protein
LFYGTRFRLTFNYNEDARNIHFKLQVFLREPSPYGEGTIPALKAACYAIKLIVMQLIRSNML